MYFATTIAERRITGKENTLSGKRENLLRKKKEKMEREYSKTYEKKIYIIIRKK